MLVLGFGDESGPEDLHLTAVSPTVEPRRESDVCLTDLLSNSRREGKNLIESKLLVPRLGRWNLWQISSVWNRPSYLPERMPQVGRVQTVSRREPCSSLAQ
jgi:hypothetical protein